MARKIDLFSLSLVTKFKSALFPQTLWSGAHTICWGTFPSVFATKYMGPPSFSLYSSKYEDRLVDPNQF